MLERGADLIVSILAIIKAGGCYVPLDPTYPAERLELMMADSGVRVLVSHTGLSSALNAPGVRVVNLDEAAEALAAQRADSPESGATPECLAYICYTSGSTGRPKGVMVGHREVVQFVVQTDYVQLRPGDRVAQASNASFDALTFEAWGAFLNGATLVGIPRDVLLSPAALRDLLRAERITTLYQTTALLNQLSREQPDIFATLREVLHGGQQADADAIRRLIRTGGKPQRLLHVYGPTETTGWCSFEQVDHVADDALTVTVGRPIGNARIYVLDRALRPVPAGVPGEAWVGGGGVVRGYLDRPGLTAARFVPDPFATEPGARMYRTGDRMRWTTAGVLEFISRLDEQVKIRGFRIEPGEVESVVSAHPDVREARVIVREDEPGEKRLAAYVVGGVTGDALRAYLRRSMPEYMVPGAIVVLDALPLTPNGKLDVRALPAPERAVADRYVAPRTPVEQALAEIWGEVLNLDRVGVEDSFFELGGHSLLVMRVVSRIRQVLGVELPLRAVFEAPSVAAQAERVQALRHGGQPLLPPVVPAERTDALPLSFAQERLWFLDRLEPGSAFYNIPWALRLRGALNAAALERALGEILRRHESLRTTFAERNGVPVQEVAPFSGFVLPVDDLSALDERAREADVRRRAAADAARPFDLAAGPLFRAALLRLADGDHVLLTCMHHIVSDGWSMNVLAGELTALYGAFSQGAGSPLPEPAVQYADFAVWQREHLRGEVLDRQIAYWKGQLAGAPALLELPADRPRLAVQRYRGAYETAEFREGLVERLEALGRREGATLYMVLLSAYQVLLGTYAGTDDVVVGSPIAGRTRAETEGLIGFFVNTLVLRTDLSGDPGFREVVARVRASTLAAYEHQDVPFERLVAELEPERSMSHAPLFQVLFALNDAGGAGAAFPGLEAQGMAPALDTTKFDLSLGVSVDGNRMGAGLEYSTDLFDRATAARMLGHLDRVLEQVAEDADRPLSQLDMLGVGERARVLEAWNDTASAYPADQAIHALFQEQAARTPDAIALVFGDASLTYRQVDARANRLANHLAARGAGPETRVAVSLEPGVEMVIALIAILKAGGAYVPLDPAYPAERLSFMLADSGVALLITRDALRGVLPVQGGVRVVSVDGDLAEITAAGDAAPARGAGGVDAGGAGALAYVIYTSGSTGRPKGVAVEHRAIVRLVRGTDWMQLTAADRVAQASSASFDAATFEVWGALLNGAALVGIPKEIALIPSELGRTIDTQRITAAFLTTALFNQVARELPTAFSPLRHLLFGGEAVDPDAVRRVLAAGGPERLLHVYGPTENTTFSSWHAVTEVPDGAVTVPIGRAVANSSLLVLNTAMRAVPVGIPGELYVGGDGLARGYLGRPALTAERFVPHPFASMPGARLYRTGDRVRWLADGVIEYLGRLDGQVKIRGFRIEPGEIEAVLRRAPGVADCAVLVREDAPGDKRLVAYVVGDADAETLRTHLRGTLPDYMVPAAFVPLETLPLNANGKVDRRALPAPDFAADAGAYVAPRTPAEEVLAGIVAELLRVERVGVHDSFFDLGGHSLLATRVVSRMREVFGVEMPLRALFEGPTVAELAERVESIRRAGQPELPSIVPVDRTDALPLSFAQERLWFLDQLESESAFYNVPAALRLRGALDAAALERTLAEIVRRHEALRTVFPEVNGAPVQRVLPFAGFVLAADDLSGQEDAAREAEAVRRAREDAGRPFDLARGPLFRASLLRLAADDHVLLLCMHHVVSDGWSMGVLFGELSALYGAFVAGEPSPLPALAVQYADFAVWQRAHLQGAVLEGQIAYWKGQLAGAPALLELPADHPRPAVQRYRGTREPVEFPAALAERLEALGRREGATLYMVLLAAFQVLLGKYAGTDDVVVGSPIAGRTRGETEALIGFFVNTLVLRTDLSGDPGFRGVLRRVRAATLAAYEHQEVPFERLVAELAPERSMSHAPLFQVLFALQNAGAAAAGLAGLRTDAVVPEGDTVKFDMSLALATHGGALRGVLEYSTDLFERATIVRMTAHLERVLEQVAEDADRPLSALDLAGPAERAQVEAWNATEREYPRDACIHTLFEGWAARTPDALALEFGDASLTYAALDARANRLAHHLRRHGVGPEVRVALCLERGPDLVAAVLGILKAGGAYVGLDPAYPAERLAYMLADSAAAVLVTRESLRGALPAREGLVVVSVDGAAAEIAAESTERLVAGTVPRSLAHVMYTSGSTGTPKGVAIEHGSVVRLVHHAGYARLGPDEVILQAGPISFDSSTLEVWSALLMGGRLAILPSGAPSLAELGTLMRRHGVTLAWLTSGLFQAMVEERLEDLGVLRQVMSGGDVLPAWHVMKVRERFPHMRIVNGYGPTENTVFTCCYTIPDGWSGATLPIGGPVANTRVYVLDGTLRPVPIGVPGELFAAGDGLARGYLGRPALTAERFLPDPSVPGGRMYRTGDLGRWLPDGLVDFRGRIDTQVKIRGFRIEPGEVEALLRGMDGVRDCAVIVREDVPGDKRLVAYVVGDADADGLRAHLRGTLPDYMVPAAFVTVDALPLTPNGKLDRRALPAPDFSAADAYVAPRTPTEEVLAGIWADTLRLERVGAQDGFFDVGGHSLLATRVVSRVRRDLGVELPLRTLFERPVLAELAAEIDRLRGAGGEADAAPIIAVERGGDLPVSFAQERLWFVDALDPGSPVYAMPMSYRLTGLLDEDALRRTITELVRRHEPLRTSVPAVDGVPRQRIAPPPAEFDLPATDLRDMAEDARAAEARRLLSASAAHRFDVARGPLFRAELVRLADDEHLLLMNLHHVVGDGWSLGVLMEELAAIYGAFSRGEPSPLPAPALQYADYAAWQRTQLSGAALERQTEFWRRTLDGAPALLELPTDRPRPPLETHRGALETLRVPAELAQGIHALARREGGTLFMVLLAALDVVLGRLSGQEDVVVGTPIAGRTRAETDRMMGLFLNSLALRTDLSGDPTFRELLGRVREATLAAYAHQDLPFERLLEELRPERSLAHAPVFQVMLNLLNFQGGELSIPGLEVAGAEANPQITSKFDLTLYVRESEEGIGIHLVYAADLFDAARMRELLSQMEGVLRQASDAPETRIGALALATDAARAVLPDPAAPLDDSWRGAVHEVFAAQARRTPDALAVEDPRERWSYAELDAATDAIARYLADGGVGVGDVVAITGHRSAALVRGLIGTMKSGAAFLVLDPAYPAARLVDYVRIAKPAAHLHLSAAADLPGEIQALLAETVRASAVLNPRGDGSADEVASVDGIDGLASAASPVSVEVGPDTLAYLSFTSGTTGTPKAVMGRHASLTHFTPFLARSFGLTANDRYSLLSGLAHDPLHRDVFTPLQTGAAVVAPLPDEVGTPGYLARWMREAGITVTHLTPAMGQLLADAAEGERIPSLHRAFFVGDVLRRADVARLTALAPALRVVNYYGSTETQRAVSYHEVEPELEPKEVIPLGKGLPGVQLLVRNASGAMAGIGEVGEIWMRSPHLAA
ncbi:MAG TPA: amino acid adenylation domain-containing protein, partial [Longimicrobium sp.]|nr:amino acid adenylation domain-containing protein [Longimicrobium sp.]